MGLVNVSVVRGVESDTLVDGFEYVSQVTVSGASYDSVSFSTGSEETTPEALFFSSDGTKMYVTGRSGADDVYQYTLATAWDLSTASYDDVSFPVGSQETNPLGLAFSSDGTRMYVCGWSADAVHQYNLSTPWDISTASYASKFIDFLTDTTESTPFGITFSDDGTRLYMVGQQTEAFNQYTLTTPWELDAYTFDGQLDISAQDTIPMDCFMSSDTRIFMIEDNTIFQYTFGTAKDIATLAYDGVSFSFDGLDSMRGVYLAGDVGKMFVIGTSSDSVYQYSL